MITSLERRQNLLTMGLEKVKAFSKLNGISIPNIVLAYSPGFTGLYEPYYNKIKINLDVTALEVHNPAHMRWSWPGWKTDRTACGVVAHEFGHHTEYVLAKQKRFKLALWKEARKLGRPVSGYEPNYAEAFAETMRVFILNPNLLELGIPSRYAYIIQVLGLLPSETRDWKTVIGNEKYFPAAEKWIGSK